MVLIFKSKGDLQHCSDYRGINLMSHTMKTIVFEGRLRR